MLRRSRRASGDTIIEVLLAVTIFSLLAAVTLTLMNQSVNAAQRAVEITLVRQQIDAQADMLRVLHGAAAKSKTPEDTTWASIAEKAENATGNPASTSGGCPVAGDMRSNSFALTPSDPLEVIDAGQDTQYQLAGTNSATPPYAQVTEADSGYTAYGIWIEPSTEGIDRVNNAAQAKVGAYVFRIRACWDGPGLSTPMQLETIVKLYDVLDDQDFSGPDEADPDDDLILLPYSTTLQGTSNLRCNGQKPVEEGVSANDTLFGGSITASDPSYAAYANCFSAHSGTAAYNCVNYDALYDPQIPSGHNGTYKVTIEYEDANCGGDPIPNNTSYQYKLKICKTPQSDGTSCDTWLSEMQAGINGGSGGSVVFEDVDLRPGDKFGIRWPNNRFIYYGLFNSKKADPDFMIKTISFEEQL